jgi:hypothetical protein
MHVSNKSAFDDIFVLGQINRVNKFCKKFRSRHHMGVF